MLRAAWHRIMNAKVTNDEFPTEEMQTREMAAIVVRQNDFPKGAKRFYTQRQTRVLGASFCHATVIWFACNYFLENCAMAIFLSRVLHHADSRMLFVTGKYQACDDKACRARETDADDQCVAEKTPQIGLFFVSRVWSVHGSETTRVHSDKTSACCTYTYFCWQMLSAFHSF